MTKPIEEMDWQEYLASRRTRFAQARAYEPGDFLYGHVGPAPQVSRDHPFGQAPVVLNIPDQEMRDWEDSIGANYKRKAVSYGTRASRWAAARMASTGGAGYADVSDELFDTLICEGLYSKFLCGLDPVDRKKRFRGLIVDEENYDYWKSDYSCMRVVKKTLPGAYVAPSVVLLRARKGEVSETGVPRFQTVAIALAWLDRPARQPGSRRPRGKYRWLREPILRPAPGTRRQDWEHAKLFALQGAIHRINLMDHTRVHFPGDTINAFTKTILPIHNLVFQLLEPHFRTTLGVNHAVIEGAESLINRNETKVYTPFVAKGREIRKLFPFAWFGATYYGFQPNSAYPPYAFDGKPPQHPSEYGRFMEAYFKPIRDFVRAVLEHLPPVELRYRETDWLEIQRWAYHISSWIPGFPSWKKFVFEDEAGRSAALDVLADIVADIIHNASVVHSSDHASLHTMMNDHPVPFVLRIPPPGSGLPTRQRNTRRASEFVEGVQSMLRGFADLDLNTVSDSASDMFDRLFGGKKLCFLKDLVAARFADLLFYLPHNSSLLIDCDYRFEKDPKHPMHGVLHPIVEQFQADLRRTEVDVEILRRKHNLPLLEPREEDAKERRKSRETQCIGAGIQY